MNEIDSKAHKKRDESSRELKALSDILATKFQIRHFVTESK